MDPLSHVSSSSSIMSSKSNICTRSKELLTKFTPGPLRRMTSDPVYSVSESRYLTTTSSDSLLRKTDWLGDQDCSQFEINSLSDNLCALCRATLNLRTFNHLSNSGAKFKHHNGPQLLICALNGCKFCSILGKSVPPNADDFPDLRIVFSWAVHYQGNLGRLIGRYEHMGLEIPQLINVFVPPGCPPLAFDFPPAPNLDDTNEIATKQMNSWLTNCKRWHRRCGKKEIPMLPKRVIDVENMRLHIAKWNQEAQYTALSYCWGGPQRFRTTVDALPSMKKSIPLASMPKTLQDAITVTKQLKIQYLWVDSLCILQDDEKDMADEINNMHLIYKNATVVIAAEVPSNVDEGFLHRRYLAGFISVPFPTKNNSQGEIYLKPELQSPFAKEALATRAWAFQETVLTSRLLVFSRRGIVWSCVSDHSNQDNLGLDIQSLDSLRNQTHHHRQTFSNYHTSLPHQSSMHSRDLFLKWRLILHDYIPLQLTFPSDKLPALAGIAREFQPMIDSRYVAGMWAKDLISQLGWSRPLTEGSIQSHEYMAPSWSWASINGNIHLPDTFRPYETRTEAIVISCIVEPLFKEARFGRVKDGGLELDAFVVETGKVPRAWLSTTRMDMDATPWDGDCQEGKVRCLVLGYHVVHRWEGLFVREVGEGKFQRIGFFRLGRATTLDMMGEEEIKHPSQLGGSRQKLMIL